jgi:putative chitobiose transport system permease protein
MTRSQRYLVAFFLTPVLLLLGIFAFLPMGQVAVYSLQKISLLGSSEFIGLENYRRLFADSTFWWTLLNSALYIVVTPVLMVLSLSLAMILREELRAKNFFRTLYFLPVVTPVVIAGIAWRWIFNEDVGILNYLLSAIGITHLKIHWLTEYPLNIVSAMAVTVWRGLGYYMVIFLAGLTAIPKEIDEASVLDGATWWQKTLFITVPMLRPTLSLVFIISSISAIKVFTEIYTLMPGAPMANKTLVLYMYREAFERFDLGFASAAGVILFLVTLGFSYPAIAGRLMKPGEVH